MSITDKDTGLLNRNAYKAYLAEKRIQTLPSVACIYLDANGDSK